MLNHLHALSALTNARVSQTFALYSIPYVIAYAIASRKNLRIWLATQRTPVPLIDSAQVASSQRRYWAKVLAAYSLWFLLFGAFSMRNNQDVRQMLMTALVVALGSLAVVSVSKSVADLLRVVSRSVHRNTEGDFVLRRVPQPISGKRLVLKIVIILSAGALTVQSILQQRHVLAAVLSAFVSYHCTQIYRIDRASFKVWFFSFTTVIGIDAILTALFLYYYGTRVFTVPDHSHEGESETLRTWEERYENAKWLFPAVLSMFPGMVISLARRFDYHLHVTKQEETSPLIQDEGVVYCTVPPPAHAPDVTEGIIIPTNLPVRFKLCYYNTALIAWMFSFAGLVIPAMYCFVGPAPTLSGDGDGTSSCYVMRLLVQLVRRTGEPEVIAIVHAMTVPMVMSVMMVVAAFRGELRRLWNYTEEWKVKKGQGVSLG